MLFTTKYEKRDNQKTDHGNRIAPVYTVTSSERGTIELEVTGEKDIYAEIQSHADSVDIKNIMLRYEMGDEMALNKTKGQYIDITQLPTTFADVLKTVIDSENQFNELPLDIRKEYNFSTAEYIADIGSEKWLKLFNPSELETAVEEKEVVANE